MNFDGIYQISDMSYLHDDNDDVYKRNVSCEEAPWITWNIIRQ